MAESTIPAVRVLFVQAGTSRRIGGVVARHSHGFWQAEVCRSGDMRLATADGMERRIAPTDVVLIPPGVAHGFRYRGTVDYRSVKFAVAGLGGGSALVLPAARGAEAHLRQALAAITDSAPTGPTPAAAIGPAAAALPSVLAALLAVAGLIGAPRAPASRSVSGQVRDLVAGQRLQAWTVSGVARRLGLSPNHLSARFQAETGEGLKRWLDRERAGAAAEVLTWSDEDVGTIALLCGFSDLFAFSRFFRRVQGISPRSYRARVRR